MIISRLLLLRPIHRNNLRQRIKYCTAKTEAEIEKEKELERLANDASIDEPPTACCQSGCANCVFIVWAETLTKKMNNAGPEIAEKIMKSVEDPSMRAYLELELRLRGVKK
ncbi:oxidoreductase-like domain-containing protein 1 [Leguminivora glycinivorella]|uniref:oxidoreductase-like domain-containing protein 1 n=1 Tax=Leguminivora glycinivorella TaxID=1035111 RepID=UPI00200BA31F|nr:oxidoreductase-like domain-containing protein 1 [Leguminivora glycinivorella]